MRLLVVTQYFWPEDFRINDLVTELVRRGHEVTVLTGHPNYPDGRIFSAFLSDPRRFDSYAGAKIVRVPLVTRGSGGARLVANYASFALSACLIGSLKLRGLAFDAIFGYEPSPITVGIPAIWMRTLKRAPLAFWVLDLWPETLHAIGAIRSRRLLALVGRLTSAIYDRCDVILAQSRSFMAQIEARCTRRRRIEYFPSWAEPIFSSAANDATPELPPKDGRFDVMFAGNIGDAQDFPAILAAAENLSRGHAAVRWLVVGDGRAADWVASEVWRRGLENTVILLGRHPLERMPAFYHRADAVLVALRDAPIFAMTIPAKLQSYLAAGVPIIGMLNGEGARVIMEAGAGVTCSAGDATALGRAVLELARRTPQERAALGARGRAYSLKEFDRAALVSRLEECLATLERS